MKFLEIFLRGVAKIQKRFGLIIILLAAIFSAIMTIGMLKIEFDGDMNNNMPQHLPIFVLNNKITDEFSGQDTIFLMLQIDESTNSRDAPTDIRSPEIMEYLIGLEAALVKESSIEEVISLAPLAKNLDEYGMLSLDMIKATINSVPGSDSLISKDKKIMMAMVKADVGTGDDKIRALENLIREKIESSSVPAGVKVTITGTPSIIVTILELLQSDAVYTLILASIIILILLFIMQKSFTKGFLIFVPISLGIIWTLGTMGWIGMKINVATAGLGAMLLGLGVEYGVFMFTRYQEERDKGKNQYDSLLVSVPAVGSAVLGSGTTTIVGFLALTLSFMPMLQKLGLNLALGIFYCIVASVFVEPVIILFEERFERWNTLRKSKNIKDKMSESKAL